LKFSCLRGAVALMAGDGQNRLQGRSTLRVGSSGVRPGSEVALAYEAALARPKVGAIVDFAFDDCQLPSHTIKAALWLNLCPSPGWTRNGGGYDRVRMRLKRALCAAISFNRKRQDQSSQHNGRWFSAITLPPSSNIHRPLPPAGSQDYLLQFQVRNTYVGNFLDCCALSVPVNEPGAAPVGLMLMAPWGQDQNLFSVGQAVEHFLL
jgi:hypothetical protein